MSRTSWDARRPPCGPSRTSLFRLLRASLTHVPSYAPCHTPPHSGLRSTEPSKMLSSSPHSVPSVSLPAMSSSVANRCALSSCLRACVGVFRVGRTTRLWKTSGPMLSPRACSASLSQVGYTGMPHIKSFGALRRERRQRLPIDSEASVRAQISQARSRSLKCTSSHPIGDRTVQTARAGSGNRMRFPCTACGLTG